ncbi:transposon Ty3-I Gag-Pol polyprotein [Trichonephila clavipes]|nr:transposon Ty3-I Gag-Pol polyprotein [Trichonephila clavipes]
MSPETFRQKFMKHQRIPARSWRDFVFEITSYFEEWLDGMESQRYKLPFKQEPKQPTFKPTCYSCGRVGHTSRVCHAKNHKKTSPIRQINAVETNERFQEQSSAILTAKVAIPAVIDTGAQISVVRADVVEGQSVDSGGTIQIMSAFGEREVTELKIFNLKIDDSRHG